MARVWRRNDPSDTAERELGLRHIVLGVMALVMCLSVTAAGFAHKPRPTPATHARRCPLIDGRGGNFDTAKTDAMMKASRCWLNI